MGKRKYRTVVAALLVGAALFSPLLCGMSCLEKREMGTSAVAESAPRAEELVAEFAASGVIGCVLSHIAARIDFSGWADRVEVQTWLWVGVGGLRLSEGVWRGGVLWR